MIPLHEFSGSYAKGDVIFLLKILQQHSFISVTEKEKLIQSGQLHYSEILSAEKPPSGDYVRLFEQALSSNRQRMARDCLKLAQKIGENHQAEVVLVSLLRAGTPIGVIVKHLLEQLFDRKVTHYSVSIIRDRGIDKNALRYILQQGHDSTSIVFVDGWTGKGVISHALEKSIAEFNAQHQVAIDSGLYVLADLAGTAACSATSEDYLIPSSILNATVSGLVSRTVLNEQIGAHDFHGCVYYEELSAFDKSRTFAQTIIDEALAIALTDTHISLMATDRNELATVSSAFLKQTMAEYDINDSNLIKPGIGEATRVLLRRVPRLLIIANRSAPDVAHLIALAKQKAVPIVVRPNLPYQAVSLIGNVLDG